jgi:hypothetical protein
MLFEVVSRIGKLCILSRFSCIQLFNCFINLLAVHKHNHPEVHIFQGYFVLRFLTDIRNPKAFFIHFLLQIVEQLLFEVPVVSDLSLIFSSFSTVIFIAIQNDFIYC